MKKLLLTRGAVAKVDDADYERCLQRRWWLTSDGYAKATFKYQQIALHVFIKSHYEVIPPGQIVDHLNRKRLDCRNGNLRICTRSQNNHNRTKRRNCSSRFTGVSRASRTSWAVYFNGRYVRSYSDKRSGAGDVIAALHYDWLAQQRGHANLNFPARYSEACFGKGEPLTAQIFHELIMLSYADR
jgi:hypothetical protein